MLTDELKRAGWGPCPPDASRQAWEAHWGGRPAWQVRQLIAGRLSPISHHNPDPRYAHLGILDSARSGVWRPVHPETQDYCAAGWGAVIPTGSGLWWRKGWVFPVEVWVAEHGTWGLDSPILNWRHAWEDKTLRAVTDDGEWIGPCLEPPQHPALEMAAQEATRGDVANAGTGTDRRMDGKGCLAQ